MPMKESERMGDVIRMPFYRGVNPEPTPERPLPEYWLTVAGRLTACDGGDCWIAAGADYVYRHEPQEAWCPNCAGRLGIEFSPSKKWREHHPTFPVIGRPVWRYGGTAA